MPKTKGREAGFQMGAEHRTKIANSKILNNLIKFAEGDLSVQMEPHRVTAALGLLRKVMPDMTEAMVKGDGDAPIVHKIVREIVRAQDPDG